MSLQRFQGIIKYIKIQKIKIKIKLKSLFVITVLSVITTVSTTISVFTVSYYAMSYLPPERALFIVVYFIFISFGLFPSGTIFSNSIDNNPFSNLASFTTTSSAIANVRVKAR